MKLISLIACLLSSLLFSCAVCEAQENQVETQNKNSAGLTLSNISGYGLYYDAISTEDFVLRPTAFAYLYDSDTFGEDQKIFNYQIGLELQKHFYSKKNRSLYILAGSYYYHDEDQTFGSEDAGIETEKETILNSLSLGFGVGVEYRIQRLVISVHAGLKMFKDKAHTTETGKVDVDEDIFKLKEGGGLSVGFTL